MGCLKTFVTKLKHVISPPGQTPLDPVIMFTVFVCNLANAMIITMPFSFLPRMMREFGIEEKEVGNYVGLVASALFVGRSCASYLWGWLCDHIGRKKSLLISMGLLTITTLLFGFSRSFLWALLIRLLQGLFGGLIIALKATVFALCDETNGSLGMALVISAFQIGLIVGPALGGFLVFPAKSYPSTFSEDSLFGKFPFLLPILINCLIMVLAMFLTIIKVPETLKSFIARGYTLSELGQTNIGLLFLMSFNTIPIIFGSMVMQLFSFFMHPGHRETKDEKTTLLNGDPSATASSNKRELQGSSDSIRYLDMYAYDVFVSRESYTVLGVKSEKKKDKEFANLGTATVSHFQIEYVDHDIRIRSSQLRSTCCRSFKESSVWHLLKIRKVQLCLCLYAVFSFITTGFDETFPIFADSSTVYGGLGFSSDEIGTTILMASIPMVVLVFFIGRLERKIGSKMMLIMQLYIMIFGLPLFAYTGSVPQSYLWYILIPVLLVERFSMSCGFIAVNVLLNNAADPKYMGLINGLGMTASCVFRSISPTVLGSLYSWSLKNEGRLSYPFNHHFPFVLCSFIGLVTLVIAVFLPGEPPVRNLLADIETETSSGEEADSKRSPEI